MGRRLQDQEYDEIVRPGRKIRSIRRSFEIREGWYPVSVSLPSPSPTGTVHPGPRIAANPGFCADCGVLGKTAYRLRAAVKSGGIRRIGEKTRDKHGFISRKVLSFGEPGPLWAAHTMPKSENGTRFRGVPKLRTFPRGARRLYAREFLYILRALISQKRNAIKTGENGRNPERAARCFKWGSRRYPLSDSIISRKITRCNFMDRPPFGGKNGPHGKREKSRAIKRKT